MFSLPPSSHLEKNTHTLPHLVIAVSDLDLASVAQPTLQAEASSATRRIVWVPAGVAPTVTNNSSKPCQFITLEFKPEKQNQ